MNSTKRLLLTLLTVFTVFMMLLSCDTTSNDEFEPITVSGLVTDAEENPLSNAIVRIVNPEPEKFTTTNDNGDFTFEIQVDSTITYTVEATKEGHGVKTQDFLAIPERNVDLPSFRMGTDSGDSGDSDDDSNPPADEESEGSAYITLQSVSEENIQVRETGGVETAEFEFMITDSTGTPVSQSNAATVNFEISSGPEGGESIYPDSVETLNGIAKAALTSGTASGVVQIRASFTRDGNTMQSKPVSITISGGLPSDEHFEVSAGKKNIPSSTSEPNEITVLLGDKYGNTVPEGTAVYFSTNKGTINGSATTDADGYVSAQLKTNQTAPGIATVQAETVDENSSKLTRQIDILFSGKPQLSVTSGEIDLEAFTSETFRVGLADENGHPLSEGTQITVEVNSEDLELSGDTDVTLQDETASGNGTTEFEFVLSNPSGDPIYQNVTVTVKADGPNGTALETLTFQSPDAPVGEPSAIALAEVSETNIHVKETGRKETSTLSFLVTDEYGNPLTAENSVDVEFSFAVQPGGGEQLSPAVVKTNDEGIASTQLRSGTESGVVQVQALVSGTTIQSSPVSVTISGGYPDDAHFEVSTDRKNIAAGSSEPITVTALLGDKYGNTVPEGTAVYFSTNKGTINGSATTDAEGYVSSQLKTNQTAPGIATVQIETVGENSTTLTRNTDLLFSGTPQLSVTPQTVNLENFTSETFSVGLADENGNPLAEGTQITVEVNSEDLELSGDTDVTLQDANAPGSGSTEFEFVLTNPSGDPIYQNVTVTVRADGPNGTALETLTFEAPDAPVGEPSAIALGEVSETNIHVKETGRKETSTLSFLVTDEYGNPLTADNPVDVEFSFAVQPGGGEQLSPEVVTTNDDGIAATQLRSGTESGVVQVQALVSGTTIQSSPASVTISGGYPDDAHFEVSTDRKNIAAESSDPIAVTALLGDKYGNTVPEGTAVHFSTNKGTINGSTTTDADGYVSAQLKTNQTAPGVATVQIETIGENNVTLIRNVDLLFSGKTQLSVTPQTVNLENFTSETFSVEVEDENGKPLAEGTTLSVALEHPELTLAGDTQVTIADHINDGAGVTQFEFSLENPGGANVTQDVKILVSVDGPNGSVSEQLEFDAPQQPLGEAASIYLESISETDIGVQSTGQNESSKLTFVVVDENGNPLNHENSIDVDFRFGNAPGGGEYITEETVTTDADGRATATVISGTASGTVQVVAEFTQSDGVTIRNSTPVQLVIHAGLPSQSHFTVKPGVRNVSLEEGGKHVITAYAGDKHGNEVPDGTAIYFTTDGGYIYGSAYTSSGVATTELTVANPIPPGGIATITATTADDNEQQVISSTQIIFSGAPEITVNPETFDIANAEDQQFDYSVSDGNGNPMVPGTTITVTVEGDEISILGDVDITVGSPNGSFSNLSQLTDYSFIIDDANPDVTNESPVQITIEVEGPNGTARKSITGAKAKVQP